ncbi:unnamed protein product, partial [Coregonus sp. 'balchen']
MDPRSEGSDPRAEGTDYVPNSIPYVPEQRSELCVSEAHSQQLLGMLRSFRERGLLFDFTITSPEAVRCFLDFCYSGEMVVTHENVSVLFRACSDFLIGTLELSNCLMLLALAEGYGSASLLQQANEFVVQNFHDLSMTPDFLDMPLGVLELCLGSDSLSVPSEEVAVRSSLRWTNARPATTQSYIYIHKTEENGEIHHSFCYCLDTDQWRELPQGQGAGFSMTPDPPGSSLTSYAEKLFVTGGCRGNCCRTVRLHVAEPFHDATAEVWCYCPITHTCTPAPDMGKPRTMHTAVTTLGRLYVLGGRTGGERDGAPSLMEVRMRMMIIMMMIVVMMMMMMMMMMIILEISDSFNPSLDCFLRYDAVSDQWSHLVAEFGQFFHATLVKAVSVNNTLHLCDLSTYKVYSFCPETCVWQGEGSFECAGFNAGAVGVANRIYILGGDYSPDEITDEVQVYHSGRGQWEEVTPMPRPLTEFHCQVISFNRYRDPWGGRDT